MIVGILAILGSIMDSQMVGDHLAADCMKFGAFSAEKLGLTHRLIFCSRSAAIFYDMVTGHFLS